MDSVAVIVPSYGDEEFWEPLARRALDSVERQTYAGPVYSVWNHHPLGLEPARNEPAKKFVNEFNVDWLVFLDADDELDERYVECMMEGSGDVRQPSTLGVVDGVEDKEPVLIPPRNLLEANYIVVGAPVRSSLFIEVGGFRDLPVLEDWDLWLRCYVAGAEFGQVPEAIYKVHIDTSRESRGGSSRLHGRVYSEIRRKYRDYIRRERK